MHRPLAAAFLATLLVPRASAQSDDAARLIPANATIVVRAQSADALNDFVRLFGALSPETAAFDLERALGEMRQDAFLDASGVPEDPEGGVELDPGLPLFFAVSIDPAAGPGLTLVLPVTNGKPVEFFDELAGPWTGATLGRYTAGSTIAGFAPAATPSALLADLPAGILSAHVDLKALLAQFRPLIDMGMQQAEMAMDQIDEEEMPFDVQPLLEAYLEGARAVMDSAEALDCALVQNGDEVAFQLDFRAAAGSKLDGWAYGPSADLTRLAGVVDPRSSVQFLFNRNWTEYWERFEGILDAVLEMYPEPLQSDLGTMLTAQKELGKLLHPGFATGLDFTPQGMHAAYVMSSSDAPAFLAGVEKAMVALDRPGGMFHLGPVESWTADGIQARVHPLTIDYTSLQKMLEELEPTEAPGDAATFQGIMESIYGRDLRVLLAARGDLVLVGAGNDESLLRGDLARLRAPAAPGPNLQRLIARIPDGSAGVAYHFDFGQTMSQMFAAMRALIPTDVPVFPETGASFDFWGAIQGRTWTGGMALSVQELVGFVQAMQAFETR